MKSFYFVKHFINETKFYLDVYGTINIYKKTLQWMKLYLWNEEESLPQKGLNKTWAWKIHTS